MRTAVAVPLVSRRGRPRRGFATSLDPHDILANVNGCPHYQDPPVEREAAAGSAASLSEIATRLGTEFPTAAPDQIGRLLEASLGRTHDARVQNYRLVLAEREVRERLRRRLLQPVEAVEEAPDQVPGGRARGDEG